MMIMIIIVYMQMPQTYNMYMTRRDDTWRCVFCAAWGAGARQLRESRRVPAQDSRLIQFQVENTQVFQLTHSMYMLRNVYVLLVTFYFLLHIVEAWSIMDL